MCPVALCKLNDKLCAISWSKILMISCWDKKLISKVQNYVSSHYDLN